MSMENYNNYDKQDEAPKISDTEKSKDRGDQMKQDEALLLVDKEFSKETKEVVDEAKQAERLLKTEILVNKNPLAHLYYKYARMGKAEEIKLVITKLKEMKIEDKPHNIFTRADEFKNEPYARDLFISGLETQGVNIARHALDYYQVFRDQPYAEEVLQLAVKINPLLTLKYLNNTKTVYTSDGTIMEYNFNQKEKDLVQNVALDEATMIKNVKNQPDVALFCFDVYKDQSYALNVLRSGLKGKPKELLAYANKTKDPQYLSFIADESMKDIWEKQSPSDILANLSVFDQSPELARIRDQMLTPDKFEADYIGLYLKNFDEWKDMPFALSIIKIAADKGRPELLDKIDDIQKMEGGSKILTEVLSTNADALFDNGLGRSEGGLTNGARIKILLEANFKRYESINPLIKAASKELKLKNPQTMDTNQELLATSPKIASLLQFIDTQGKPFLVKDKELPFDRRSVQFISGMLKQADKLYPNQEDLTPEQRTVMHGKYEEALNAFLDAHEEKKQETDTVDVFLAYASNKTPGEDDDKAFLQGTDLKAVYEDSYGANNIKDFSSNTPNAKAPENIMNDIRDQLVQKVVAGNGGLSLVDLGLHGSPDGSAVYGPRDKGRDWQSTDFERLVNLSGEVRKELESKYPDQLKEYESKFGSLDDRIQIHIDSCFSGSKLDDQSNTVKNIALSSGKQAAKASATSWLLKAHERDKDGNLNGDFDGDGKVSFAESKLYQLSNYASSITKTTFGNAKGETIELASLDGQQNPEYDDRLSATG